MFLLKLNSERVRLIPWENVLTWLLWILEIKYLPSLAILFTGLYAPGPGLLVSIKYNFLFWICMYYFNLNCLLKSPFLVNLFEREGLNTEAPEFLNYELKYLPYSDIAEAGV